MASHLAANSPIFQGQGFRKVLAAQIVEDDSLLEIVTKSSAASRERWNHFEVYDDVDFEQTPETAAWREAIRVASGVPDMGAIKVGEGLGHAESKMQRHKVMSETAPNLASILRLEARCQLKTSRRNLKEPHVKEGEMRIGEAPSDDPDSSGTEYETSSSSSESPRIRVSLPDSEDEEDEEEAFLGVSKLKASQKKAWARSSATSVGAAGYIPEARRSKVTRPDKDKRERVHHPGLYHETESLFIEGRSLADFLKSRRSTVLFGEHACHRVMHRVRHISARCSPANERACKFADKYAAETTAAHSAGVVTTPASAAPRPSASRCVDFMRSLQHWKNLRHRDVKRSSHLASSLEVTWRMLKSKPGSVDLRARYASLGRME